MHLDILRVFAIYLVVFNHTGERGYMLFTGEMESFWYFPHMMFSVFCKVAVPIFFMISGALLLPKHESLKQLLLKRVLRMITVLIFISIPYYFWLHRVPGNGISAFFTFIYENNATSALWYLYSYIGFLLILPFLRSLVKNIKQNDFVYLLVGHIVLVGLLPCCEYLLWEGGVTLNQSFSSVVFTTQNIFYALMGYYLERVLDEKHYSAKNILISISASLVSIIVTCLMTYYQATKIGLGEPVKQEAFFNSFICIPAITVYFLVKILSSKNKNKALQKVMAIFGASVFGVYLIEKFGRALTDPVYEFLSPLIGSFLASLVWCLATCLLSFAIIIPLKQIPIVKRFVNKFI